MLKKPIRLISRLDIKGPNLIKGIHLEGLRVVGDPQTFAQGYYEQGIDELLYIDSVASLYGRNHLSELINKTTKNVFIPITVAGGIRTLDDVRTLLRAGADKIAVNTAAIKRPSLISEISKTFGSQCMVLSIEAKKQGEDWEAYIENGRERTGVNAVDWVKEAVDLGVGEILVTSIDKEGTSRGFDVELMNQISHAVSVPVIASGGMGNLTHFDEIVQSADVDAFAIADALHYKKLSINEMKTHLEKLGLSVRMAT